MKSVIVGADQVERNEQIKDARYGLVWSWWTQTGWDASVYAIGDVAAAALYAYLRGKF